MTETHVRVRSDINVYCLVTYTWLFELSVLVGGGWVNRATKRLVLQASFFFIGIGKFVQITRLLDELMTYLLCVEKVR